MTLAELTPPASEPIGLDEIKAHLRIDHDDENTLLLDLLRAARKTVEQSSGQKLISQVWRQYTLWPDGGRDIVSMVAPVASLQAVTVYSVDGTPSQLPLEQVTIDRTSEPETFILLQDINPASVANGLEFDIVCGFGDFGVDVPDTLKRAILLLVAHWYEFRGAVPASQQPISFPPGFDRLMMPRRRVRL